MFHVYQISAYCGNHGDDKVLSIDFRYHGDPADWWYNHNSYTTWLFFLETRHARTLGLPHFLLKVCWCWWGQFPSSMKTGSSPWRRKLQVVVPVVFVYITRKRKCGNAKRKVARGIYERERWQQSNYKICYKIDNCLHHNPSAIGL